MKRSEERILTTHVGSLPRPGELAAHLTDLDRGTLGEEGREALGGEVREGIAQIVSRQRATGLDVVNDGELSKFGYATYVKQRLSGFDGSDSALALSELADFPEFQMGTALEVTTPACTGPVEFHGAEAVAADIANLRAALEGTDAPEAFMNAASPGIVVDYLANEHYANEEEYLLAVAEAMREEYEMIVEAGFILQLDCPDLAMGRHLAPRPLEIADFRRKVAARVEMIDHALRNVDSDRVRMHVCWGNYESPHHHDVELAEIIDLIAPAKPAGLLMEAANPRHEHEWQIFEDFELPEGKVLVPGVIDTLTPYIEHPEVIAQRIARYAGVVGRESVIAGTDCGFATFANFTPLAPEISWAKLGSLAAGAELASRELWREPAAA
jgi:5-methyltetrahydropteroyltriglutamate--homocysteine methyltransferase